MSKTSISKQVAVDTITLSDLVELHQLDNFEVIYEIEQGLAEGIIQLAQLDESATGSIAAMAKTLSLLQDISRIEWINELKKNTPVARRVYVLYFLCFYRFRYKLRKVFRFSPLYDINRTLIKVDRYLHDGNTCRSSRNSCFVEDSVYRLLRPDTCLGKYLLNGVLTISI